MSEQKYILGLDLNDNMSQISYFEINSAAPETVASDSDKEKLGIPTVLSKRKGVAQWEIGVAAQKAAANAEATIVSKLLSIAASGAKMEIEGEAYDATDLLILFVRRALNQLSLIMAPSQVECMIITVASLEGRLVDIVEKIACAMPVPRDKIVIQTYEESIYYYMLHQPAELWEHDVAVLDYSDTCLKIYELWMNRNTTPVVSFVDHVEYKEIKMPVDMMTQELSEEKSLRLDEMILRKMHDYFVGKTVSTVFLVGEGFEREWCDKTLKYLCMGRRVFQGRNLYSKGACYCGKDKLHPCYLNENFVFLGRDKLKFNLGINMIVGGKEQYLAVADAGENWYDCEANYELVLGNTKIIPFVLTPLDGKGAETIEVELTGLVDRPIKASRQKLHVSFESEQRLRIEVTDLGFGEFYPSTGKKWEKIIEMV